MTNTADGPVPGGLRPPRRPGPDVQGVCPNGCGATLCLGSGGHVVCFGAVCPDPTAADRMLASASDVWARWRSPAVPKNPADDRTYFERALGGRAVVPGSRYQEGYEAGYGAGVAYGHAAGFADAKYRAHAAITAAIASGKATANGFREAVTELVGKQE